MTHLDQRIAPAAPATDTITGRQRRALAVLLTAGFTLAVDFSILNVAVARRSAPTSGSPWPTCSGSPPPSPCARPGSRCFFGRVADLFGRRRLFLLGIAALGVSPSRRRSRRHAVGAARRPRGAGPRHRGGHPRRAVAADHVLSGRTAAGQGARPQRSADGGRLHHRRGPGRRPDRGCSAGGGRSTSTSSWPSLSSPSRRRCCPRTGRSVVPASTCPGPRRPPPPSWPSCTG